MAAQPDPVTVDPQHYEVAVENEKVRVLRVSYGPGERSEMHSHPDSVAIFLTAATARFTFPDGTTEDLSGGAGDAVWIPAMTHLPENLNDGPLDAILVELKG